MKNPRDDAQAQLISMEDQLAQFERHVQSMQDDLHETRNVGRQLELQISNDLTLLATRRQEIAHIRQRLGLATPST